MSTVRPGWICERSGGIKEYGILNGMTNATRISATLPSDLTSYLDHYQQLHGLETRSAALAAAVRALRDAEMQAAYRELGAAQEKGLEQYPSDNLDGLGE